MSPSTSTNDHGVGSVRPTSIPKPIKAGAFWAAVILPFCTLALLAGGLQGVGDFLTLGALLVSNVVALVVGHDYGE